MSAQYEHVAKRIEGLRQPHRAEVAGAVGVHPFHVIRLGIESAPRKVLLSSGMHGDEPAGVEAVLRFMERDNRSLLKDTSILVLPCLNPTGYASGTRENTGGLDLNRAFDDDGVAEIQLVKLILGDSQFDIAIDCHEDYDGKGFYFYEGHREGPNIGNRVTERVSTIGPIDGDTDPADPPLFPGVYPISASWGTAGLAPYLLTYHADHVYMGETPSTIWSMEQRVEAHLAVFDVVLNGYA